AVKELQPNIYRYENDAEAYVTLANSYMQYGAFMSRGDDIVRRLDSAAYYLQVAKTIDPQEKNIYSASGNLQLMKGNYVRAKADLETYVKLDKTNEQVYFMLGVSNRSLWQKGGTSQDMEGMMTAMQKALKLNENFTKPYLYLAEGYLAKGDKSKAKENLQKALKWEGSWSKEEESILEKLKPQTGIE